MRCDQTSSTWPSELVRAELGAPERAVRLKPEYGATDPRTMVHHKVLDAALRRREVGDRPFPRDNETLGAVGEAINPRNVQTPTEPNPQSNPGRVLRVLRGTPDAHIAVIACEAGLDQRQARSAINALRAGAHDIRNSAFRTFMLRRP